MSSTDDYASAAAAALVTVRHYCDPPDGTCRWYVMLTPPSGAEWLPSDYDDEVGAKTDAACIRRELAAALAAARDHGRREAFAQTERAVASCITEEDAQIERCLASPRVPPVDERNENALWALGKIRALRAKEAE